MFIVFNHLRLITLDRTGCEPPHDGQSVYRKWFSLLIFLKEDSTPGEEQKQTGQQRGTESEPTISWGRGIGPPAHSNTSHHTTKQMLQIISTRQRFYKWENSQGKLKSPGLKPLRPPPGLQLDVFLWHLTECRGGDKMTSTLSLLKSSVQARRTVLSWSYKSFCLFHCWYFSATTGVRGKFLKKSWVYFN